MNAIEQIVYAGVFTPEDWTALAAAAAAVGRARAMLAEAVAATESPEVRALLKGALKELT